MPAENRLLTEREAATYINMSPGYLQNDRCYGATGGRTPGPPYYRLGRRIFYKASDLDEWLEKHRVDRSA